MFLHHTCIFKYVVACIYKYVKVKIRDWCIGKLSGYLKYEVF